MSYSAAVGSLVPRYTRRWPRVVGLDGGEGALRLRSVSEEKYILIYMRIIYV